MPAIIAFLTKTLLTEKIMKVVLIALGDYLVASTKNKLDDVAWKQVKKALNKYGANKDDFIAPEFGPVYKY